MAKISARSRPSTKENASSASMQPVSSTTRPRRWQAQDRAPRSARRGSRSRHGDRDGDGRLAAAVGPLGRAGDIDQLHVGGQALDIRRARPRAAACRPPAPPDRRAGGRCSGCAGAPPADRRRSAGAGAGPQRAADHPAARRDQHLDGGGAHRESLSTVRSSLVAAGPEPRPSRCAARPGRPPQASTPDMLRRSEASPRSTSISRTPSRLKSSTSFTFCPIRASLRARPPR
jgi:hypothetical protein